MPQMLGRHSIRHSKDADGPARIAYSFWLTFGSDGSVQLSRTAPAVGRGSRAMAVTAVLPMALFETPQLKATLTVTQPEAAAELTFNAETLAEALRGAIGADIDLVINRGA